MKTLYAGLTEPLQISIELNNKCGMNCYFCTKARNNKEINIKIIKKFIYHIRNSKLLTSIMLSGGEPLGSKYLHDIIKICKKKHIAISIDTNINFKLDHIKFPDVNQIRVKVFSTSQNKHDKITGVKGHFKKTCDFLDIIQNDFKGSKVILFPVLNSNFKYLNDIMDFAKKRDMFLNIFFYPKSCSDPISKRNFWLIGRKLDQIVAKGNKNIFVDAPLFGTRFHHLEGWCPANKILMHISYNGAVKPCKFSDEIMGFLSRESVNAIWMNRIFKIPDKCIGCNFAEICAGGCIVNRNKEFNADYLCVYKEK
jgi:radical SAM protein with 4Fe4S-binding SPASM domain